MMQRGVGMFEILLKSFATFSVIYFIIELATKTVKLIFNDEDKKDVFVFIHVKNQEDTIEYVVRCTAINYLHKYGGRTVPYIVIVDRGSEDQTPVIAQKLCSDYDFIYFTTSEKYEEFKNELENQENI